MTFYTGQDKRDEHSIGKGSDERAGSKSMSSERLIALAKKAGLELIRNDGSDVFGSYAVGGRVETVPVSDLKGFLFELGTADAAGQIPKSRALEDAVDLLGVEARHRGRVVPIATRIYSTATTAYLFMADESGTVFEVDAGGWRRVENVRALPVRFVRSKAALALPFPERGSFELGSLLNTDETGLCFVWAFRMACFLPTGTMPVLCATGEQGSGKSFGCGIIRQVVDPSINDLAPLNTETRALRARLASHFVLGYDNLSRIPGEFSDLLCALTTGGGIPAFQLYKDATEVVISGRRPVLLNGIGSTVERPDLLDRTLVVPFRRLEGSGRRRDEKSLREEFDAGRAAILAEVLDRVSSAYREFGSVQIEGDLPRLADLGRWVTASEPDCSRGSFLRLIGDSRREQHADIACSDALAVAMLAFVEDRGADGITVAPSELYRSLTELAGEGANRQRGWPADASAMGKRLLRLAPVLRNSGIEIEKSDRSANQRGWRISMTRSGDASRRPAGGHPRGLEPDCDGDDAMTRASLTRREIL